MNNCNLICIIQARLTSSRLPNKVLKKINNKNSLQIIHEKLKKIKEIDEIVFAIPNNKMNMPLKKFLLKNNYKVFCGSEKNVLSRYYKTAQYYNAENILIEMVPKNKECNISITITDENGLAQALVIIEVI